MNEVKQIVDDIKKGNAKPIYLLTGDEPYFIDKISEYIEDNLLDESEKGFNQIVMYGLDTTVEDILENAKRFPMMAERQLVIVKEAQELYRTIERLAQYAANPQLSTVLVLNYKYKKVDKRKALYKNIKKTGIVFESKKLYDNKVTDWIRRTLSPRGYGITPKAALMMFEFIGNDLSRINNELEKLQAILPKGTQITPEIIERNIGISKDFNNFELQKAIGQRNMQKAFQIIQYFAQNPKDNSIIATISLLNAFFIKLLTYHGLENKQERNVGKCFRHQCLFCKRLYCGFTKFPNEKGE
jgi:DNA polymerase-3 subunit delta